MAVEDKKKQTGACYVIPPSCPTFSVFLQVSAALSGYLTAVQDTEDTVKLELQRLSDSLVQSNDLPVITQVTSGGFAVFAFLRFLRFFFRGVRRVCGYCGFAFFFCVFSFLAVFTGLHVLRGIFLRFLRVFRILGVVWVSQFCGVADWRFLRFLCFFEELRGF